MLSRTTLETQTGNEIAVLLLGTVSDAMSRLTAMETDLSIRSVLLSSQSTSIAQLPMSNDLGCLASAQIASINHRIGLVLQLDESVT